MSTRQHAPRRSADSRDPIKGFSTRSCGLPWRRRPTNELHLEQPHHSRYRLRLWPTLPFAAPRTRGDGRALPEIHCHQRARLGRIAQRRPVPCASAPTPSAPPVMHDSAPRAASYAEPSRLAQSGSRFGRPDAPRSSQRAVPCTRSESVRTNTELNDPSGAYHSVRTCVQRLATPVDRQHPSRCHAQCIVGNKLEADSQCHRTNTLCTPHRVTAVMCRHQR